MIAAQQAGCWEDIEAGTLCRVKGRDSSRPFRFQYVTITEREVSLTLYGPVREDGKRHDGTQGFIAVLPDKVVKWRSKRGRRRS